jgi:hypothetical protein
MKVFDYVNTIFFGSLSEEAPSMNTNFTLLDTPTFVTRGPAGTLLIGERAGTVRAAKFSEF